MKKPNVRVCVEVVVTYVRTTDVRVYYYDTHSLSTQLKIHSRRSSMVTLLQEALIIWNPVCILLLLLHPFSFPSFSSPVPFSPPLPSCAGIGRNNWTNENSNFQTKILLGCAEQCVLLYSPTFSFFTLVII